VQQVVNLWISLNKNSAVPLYDMKTYRGSRGLVPLILNLGTRWRWVVNYSFCMKTFSASLTKLAAFLPRLRDCSCYVRRGIRAPPPLWYAETYWYTRTRLRALTRLAISAAAR